MNRFKTLWASIVVGFVAVSACAAAAEPLCADCPPMAPIPGLGLLMSQSEITFEQWRACVEQGGCPGGQHDHGWGRGARPVINVTWQDAQAYAGWLSRKSGLSCRLPTESEWEHAAAGGASTAYWWGEARGSGMANCRDCLPQPLHGSTPAGSYPANPYGLLDMNGNLWEWTADCWDATCAQRVIKGGSWYFIATNATTRARARYPAVGYSYDIGVRVVCAGQ